METEDKETVGEKFLNSYIRFKKECMIKNINNTNEIIKLFEVWLRIVE